MVCDWKGQWLILGGHLEIVETSVTNTITSPDELGVELPLDMAGSELPLVEIEAEVFPDEIGVELTRAVVALELNMPIEDVT